MTTDRSRAPGPAPRVLYDMHPLITDNQTGPAGVAWRMTEDGRQLDANVVSLLAGDRIDTHTESDLDVLLVVITGRGTLNANDGLLPLTPGILAWLPRGSTRSMTAGPDGLSYLTAHCRRPGLQIRPRPAQAPDQTQPSRP